MENDLFICKFCPDPMQFQCIGARWKLGCLNPDREGYCYIYGNNEEDIIRKIKNIRRKKP